MLLSISSCQSYSCAQISYQLQIPFDQSLLSVISASGRKIRRLGEGQYWYPMLEVQKFDLIFQSFRLMNMTYTYNPTQNVRVAIMIIRDIYNH